MKNVFNFALCLAVLCFGFGCKENPLSKAFQPKYNCTIANEPDPKTSEEFFARAQKHIEIYSEGRATSIDDCAFGALNEAIRLNPNNADAFRVRGFYYKQEKQYDLAEADYNKAIQIEPNNEGNYVLRRFLYEDWGKFDKAIEDQTTILNFLLKNNSADNKKMVEEYQKRAELHKKANDYENAIKDYTEIIRLKPDSFSYSFRADAFREKGDFENAVKDYTEEIRLDSECKWDCEQVYYRRSEVYRKMGKNDLADADMAKFNELLAAKKDDKKTPKIPNPSSTPNSSNTISGGVLNGKATNLVKPTYPAAARAVRASGAVNVQVTVDENGNVISATAVSGHVLLRSSAVQAAKESKFNPTILSGQKVKVSGVIVYNFTPE